MFSPLPQKISTFLVGGDRGGREEPQKSFGQKQNTRFRNAAAVAHGSCSLGAHACILNYGPNFLVRLHLPWCTTISPLTTLPWCILGDIIWLWNPAHRGEWEYEATELQPPWGTMAGIAESKLFGFQLRFSYVVFHQSQNVLQKADKFNFA